MSSSVAVVIPYFQREPGVLARALQSIVAQEGVEPPAQVLIVDDGSPVPAGDELAGLPPEWQSRMQVVHQANAGPGAARNTALDLVRDDIEYVAFLDSDDEWKPYHLADALATLDLGYDIFFGDHPDLADAGRGWIQHNMPQVAQLPELPVGRGCREFPGDLTELILRSNPIAMPTAVYRYAAYRDMRFPIDFPTAEVNVFWLQLSLRGLRTALSTEIHADLGRGVNVYRGNSRGTAASLKVLHNSTRFRDLALRKCLLTDAQRTTAQDRLNVFADRFAAELIPMLRSPGRVPWQTVLNQCRIAPVTIGCVGRRLSRKLTGRRD